RERDVRRAVRPDRSTNRDSQLDGPQAKARTRVMGIFDKLKQGLQKTSQQLKDRLDRLDEMVGLGDAPAARARPIDVDTAENLEEILLMADVGVAATGEIVSAVKQRQRRGESLRELVKQEMLRLLEASAPASLPTGQPHVMLIVGVN